MSTLLFFGWMATGYICVGPDAKVPDRIPQRMPTVEEIVNQPD